MPVAAAVLGLLIGSFLNVVIGRLRSGEKGWRNRSRCPQCHAVLSPSELVPVLSFLALHGRCRSCKKPISWQYPLVEASTAVLFAAAWLLHGGTGGYVIAGVLRDWLFISTLTVVFAVDLLDMVVFDSVTLPMIAVAGVVNVLLGASAWNLLLAASIGSGFFLLQYIVSKGRWIGGGDVRIGAMVGAMVGFPGIILVLLAAYLLGAVVAVGLLASKKTTWSSQMAFGTFLSLATVLVLFFGDRVWAWYGGLLGW